MKNIYESVEELDKRVIEKFGLSEEILMENAAAALESLVDKHAITNSMIIIVAGSGNNGADGLVLARRLSGKYNVKIFMPFEAKSQLCKIQKERAERLNVKFIDKLFICDIVVDCLFGSGFRGDIDAQSTTIISQMSEIARVKIACDIPSGILPNGDIAKFEGNEVAFRANVTLGMGALKVAYFSDVAKDFVGEILIANLGISAQNYEECTAIKLLEASDCKIPHRIKKNAHKGDFGHCCIIAGEREGAGILSAMSAFAFGSGLVSVIGRVENLPPHIMKSISLPKNCNAIAFGMGLGERINRYDFDFIGDIPSVIDADIFYHEGIKDMLPKGNIVLTPHPKEFASLLKIIGIGEFSVEQIAQNRLDLARQFSSLYPKIVLVLKGANTLIAFEEQIYINTFGSSNLAKGGSGDILSGMIAALLSQGYSLLDASISASLAHSFASLNVKSSYGLEPQDLINEIKKL